MRNHTYGSGLVQIALVGQVQSDFATLEEFDLPETFPRLSQCFVGPAQVPALTRKNLISALNFRYHTRPSALPDWNRAAIGTAPSQQNKRKSASGYLELCSKLFGPCLCFPVVHIVGDQFRQIRSEVVVRGYIIRVRGRVKKLGFLAQVLDCRCNARSKLLQHWGDPINSLLLPGRGTCLGVVEFGQQLPGTVNMLLDFL